MFQCPFVMMTEVGSASIDEKEAARLREYLLEGRLPVGRRLLGQLRVGLVGRAVPQGAAAGRVSRSSTCRPNHPLFSAQFVDQEGAADRVDRTLGRAPAAARRSATKTAPTRTRAPILDKHGNIMVLMTHNTDLGDSFEREADDPQYFYQMSVPGYAFGVNTLLYALTH